MSDIDDDHLLLVGRIAAAAADVEHWVEVLASDVISPGVNTGTRFIADMSFGQRVKLAKDLYTARVPADQLELKQELDHALNAGVEAMRERDRTLHAQWLFYTSSDGEQRASLLSRNAAANSSTSM